MKIKRITTEQFMELLFRIAREEGRLGNHFSFEGKQIYTDYTSTRNFERETPELSDYEWDLQAWPEFGGNEGIYVNVFISGYYFENQNEPNREHVATVKSLNTDLATMESLGCCCGTISYYSRVYADGMIGRLSPEKEIEREISSAEERGKKKFFFPFLSAEDNALTKERGYVLCYATEAEDAAAWFSRSIYKDCKTKCLPEEEFKKVQTNLPWLDFVIAR